MTTRTSLLALAVFGSLALLPAAGDPPADKDRAQQSLRRLLAYDKDVPVDQFIDHFVSLKDGVNDEAWDKAIELTKSLVAKSAKLTEKEIKIHENAFRKYKPVFGGDLRDPEGKRLGLMGRTSANTIHTKEGTVGSLVLTNGKVEAGSGMSYAVLLSNGPVAGRATFSECIVFCDGDVYCRSIFNHCLVIATGSVKGEIIANSVVLAGGDVAAGHIDASVVRTKGAVDVSSGIVNGSNILATKGTTVGGGIEATCTVKQGDNDPLAVVPLFSLKQVGVEAKVDAFKKGVRIDTVEAGKALATAGLQKGDQVLAVNGKETETTEDLRRLLRRGFVASDETVLRVNRSGKTIELKVVFNR